MRIIDCIGDETCEQAEARVKAAPKVVAELNVLFFDMSREEYERLPGENWSGLKPMAKSPAHYLHQQKNKREDTDALKRGRVTHLAVLEPKRFHREVAVWLGGRRQGAEWKEFAAKNADREIVTGDEWTLADDIAKAVRAHPVAGRYLSSGRAEVSMCWNLSAPPIGSHPGWTFRCKGRMDWLSAEVIADLKVTKDASPGGFGREVWRYRYDAQAAYYQDGHFESTRRRLPYVLIAVEPEPPHVVQVYTVTDDILDLGREHYRALLDRLDHCRRTGKWGGYCEEETALTLPRWAAPRLDDEDVNGLDISISE